jgi:hypothetical protein
MEVFYSPEKLIDMPARCGDMLPPLHIRIKPTNACNHNCAYCAYHRDNLQLGKDMRMAGSIPPGEMLEIVEDLDDMGQGGDFLRRERALGLSPPAGNGPRSARPFDPESRPDQQRAAARRVEGVYGPRGTWLRVSMEGYNAAFYSAYRKVLETEFDGVMDNLCRLKAHGGPCYLGVSLIVDCRNQNRVFVQVSRLKDLGVDSVKIKPCIAYNDGAPNSAYLRPFLALLTEQVDWAETELSDDGFTVYNACPELDTKFVKLYRGCPDSQILPIIAAGRAEHPAPSSRLP